MATKTTGTSRDLLIHPGETIADILEERGISQAALAASTGVSRAFVSNVLAGKKDISANFAMALEYALGVPKSFWLNLQANYDAELLEACAHESITQEERVALNKLSEVVKYFQGVGEIAKGLSPEATILALRHALRVSNISNLVGIIPQGAFRMSDKQKTDPLVLGAWLRICQIASERIAVTQSFDSKKTSQMISELKALMLSWSGETLQESLQEIFAKYGIAFSIVKHFKGAPVHGYVTRRDNGSFQMVVTIRNAWEDVFWFSLFHELGHINNGDIRGKSREFADIDGVGNQELLADAFARDALIDPTAYSVFLKNANFTLKEITHFAEEQLVKPCIVIGRLQKEGYVPWNRFTNHKPRLKWA